MNEFNELAVELYNAHCRATGEISNWSGADWETRRVWEKVAGVLEPAECYCNGNLTYYELAK